jgi:hypothetical protein
MPTFGKAAARTALPHPPNTNQKVPMNSAVALLVRDMKISFQVHVRQVSSPSKVCRQLLAERPERRMNLYEWARSLSHTSELQNRDASRIGLSTHGAGYGEYIKQNCGAEAPQFLESKTA